VSFVKRDYAALCPVDRGRRVVKEYKLGGTEIAETKKTKIFVQQLVNTHCG
jgi:hypothetical protein